ncbi:hypothetical protein [Streptomyces sp. CA-251251]|uniref:hypothetical protein n=1 Tax=Streptomyces sp. CA-251251 TaxID=3240063 RepID=UPI003D9183D0
MIASPALPGAALPGTAATDRIRNSSSNRGHDRVHAQQNPLMQLSAVAIVVASASALFTGANMLVSVLNYRRTRPRVRVHATYDIIEGSRVTAPEERRGLFRAHVINLGQTDTTITDVYLWCRFTVNWKTVTGQFARLLYGKADLFTDEPDLALPAFGGTRLEIEDLPERKMLRGKARPVAMTVSVTLSDGRQVRGRWIRARELNRKDAWLREALDS